MKHLWLRAEHRENEKRVGLTPQGATQLINNGVKVSVEASDMRIISTKDYKDAGCEIVSAGSWENAPEDAIIFGLKELPNNDNPLKHSHIMFGHAFKGQVSGKKLLKKFKSGGGTLYDIEYLTEETGKRVAAFGYWAGFAGAYVTLKVWVSQLKKEECPPLSAFNDKRKLLKDISNDINSAQTLPSAIVIGSLGRVGTGVCDFCEELSLNIKKWDLAETLRGGPFHEVLNHDILFNCVVATPNTPVFFQPDYIGSKRKLSVIGDIACDPDSDYNPIPIYSNPTTWNKPSLNIADDPPLEVMAIDNLPSLLPKESSIDFSEQLFPYLLGFEKKKLKRFGKDQKKYLNQKCWRCKMVVHWCGTGLSAIPGLKKLIMDGNNVLVWNRTVSKATKALADVSATIHEFDINALEEKLAPEDIIVSMLPGDWHVPLAKLAISKKAHFVSSSYISPEMKELHNSAQQSNVVLMNEIGLDPGIDHLMAHKLIEDFKSSKTIDTETEISFLSYCGGVPKIPNDFKYKFSWSPLGVLKALKSPSRSLKNFKIFDVNRPWDAITHYTAPLAQPEEFEVYPNRDSIPFMQQYKFDPDWTVKQFVRGTLRLSGWAESWSEIFKEIETLNGETGEKRLVEMSEVFWRDNAYGENEPDRVILCVDLKAEKGSEVVWHKTFKMDAWGDHRGTAMARLVSNPVYFAVEAIANKQIEFGVNAAVSDPVIVDKWLKNIKELAQEFDVIDHLS